MLTYETCKFTFAYIGFNLIFWTGRIYKLLFLCVKKLVYLVLRRFICNLLARGNYYNYHESGNPLAPDTIYDLTSCKITNVYR